jgi:hypothetical protein
MFVSNLKLVLWRNWLRQQQFINFLIFRQLVMLVCIRLVVRDKKNDTSNEYSIVVGETDEQFTFNFKVENIKIIPGAYDVVVSRKTFVTIHQYQVQSAVLCCTGT